MIAIRDLRFEYPGATFRLQMESLDIATGDKVAIVGPSGSGKTTLLNLIAGIAPVSSGSLRVLDREMYQMSDAERRNFRSRHIGFVFQQFELIPYLPLLDNILLPYLINQSLTLNAEVRERAVRLTQQLGLADKQRRYIHQLSQGEQQRVALCRSLINQPQLLLADEPTGNLDVSNKRKVLDILFEQSQANRQTLLVVTHDTGILDGFDRILDFNDFCQVGAR